MDGLLDRAAWTDARTAFWIATGVTAAATILLGALATRLRWIDRRDGEQAARKPRATPVPLVGGAALLAGLLAARVAGALPAGALPWWALGAAFGLGLLDDLIEGGLAARAKFAGQIVVALTLALDPGVAAQASSGGLAPRALTFVVALVAQNALNTYDNTDGAACSLALVGLFPSAALRGALLGFLPFNLVPWRRGSGPGDAASRAPWAYLGDSGSHLLGVLIAADPRAWPVLLLPVLDLARLVRLRLSRGRPPWRGDRSHLAHRMQAADWPPAMAALTLAAVAALPVVGALWSSAAALAGTLGLLAAFALLVQATPDPEV